MPKHSILEPLVSKEKYINAQISLLASENKMLLIRRRNIHTFEHSGSFLSCLLGEPTYR